METGFDITRLDTTLFHLQQTPKTSQSRMKTDIDLAKAEETAENFEAFFISKMMESMFEGISTDGMFGGGHAEKIYRSLLLDEYGKAMAKTGSIGVKDEVMRSILEMQEMQTQGYTENRIRG